MTIDNDNPTNLFLWMLDGGRANGDGSHLDDVLELLGSERKFVEAMTKKRKKRSWDELRVDDALIGMERFFRFCRGLEHLLDDADMLPLLQSEMWHYHGYWFRQLGKRAGTRILRALERFGTWEADEQNEDLKAASRRSIEQLRTCLEKLSSKKHEKALRDALREASN